MRWLILITITASYLAVLFTVFHIYYSPFNPSYRSSIGNDPRSGACFAIPLIVVPYVVGGVFLGLFNKNNNARLAVVVGLITTLSERLLILGLAAWTLHGFHQVAPNGEIYYVEGGPDLIGSIQAEALPYFTWAYILLGIPLSILLLCLVSQAVWRFRTRT